jgi:hypothetical protein
MKIILRSYLNPFKIVILKNEQQNIAVKMEMAQGSQYTVGNVN